MTRRIIFAAVLAALALAAPGVVGALRDDPEATTPAAAYGVPTANRISPAGAVAFWADRIEDRPNDHLSRTELANAHIAVARETGDITAYERAGAAVTAALDINPDHGPALLTLAVVHIANHRFEAALSIADELLEGAPDAPPLLAVRGDALLELGRYGEAESTYDALLAAERSAPTLTRLSRLSFVRGRSADAVTYAEQAQAAASELDVRPEALAFYDVALANTLLLTGQGDAALDVAATAVERAPALPGALVALGRAQAATGDLEAAAGSLGAAVAIVPEPGWLLALAEIHLASGDAAAADEVFATLRAVSQLSGPTVHSRAIARYEAEYGDPDEAVRLAEADRLERSDVYADDTLAWALYAAGRLDEAVEAVEGALSEGTRDPALLARAGEILAAADRGDEAAELLAAALNIDPRFDPLAAPRAAELLKELS